MTAAQIIAAGQAFAAAQLAATVSINDQSYTATTSGLRTERVLALGGFIKKSRVSFWVPVLSFTNAGQPLPQARECVTWNDTLYVIDFSNIDPTGTTVILICQGPDE